MRARPPRARASPPTRHAHGPTPCQNSVADAKLPPPTRIWPADRSKSEPHPAAGPPQLGFDTTLAMAGRTIGRFCQWGDENRPIGLNDPRRPNDPRRRQLPGGPAQASRRRNGPRRRNGDLGLRSGAGAGERRGEARLLDLGRSTPPTPAQPPDSRQTDYMRRTAAQSARSRSTRRDSRPDRQPPRVMQHPLRRCKKRSVAATRGSSVSTVDFYRSVSRIRSTTPVMSVCTMSGCGPSGLSTIPGLATNAARQPAASAPEMSQA